MDLYESRTGLGDMTSTLPFPFQLRSPQAGDRAGAYAVCLKTGNFGQDGEPFYRDDPEALGRVFVGPYLDYEPELARILEDDQGICGYVLAAMDSHAFYARYEAEWRPELCRAIRPRPATRADGTGSSKSTTSITTRIIFARSPTTNIPRMCTSTCCHGLKGEGWVER